MAEVTTSGDILAEARTHYENGESAKAQELVLSAWIELLIDGYVSQTDTLLAQLPDALSDDVDVLSVRACCARLRGDRDGALLLVARARARRSDTDESPLFSLFLEDDENLLYTAVTRSLEVIMAGTVRGRSHAYAVYLVGWTLLRLRKDPMKAHQLLEAARADAELRGLKTLSSRAATNRAFALAFAGRFGDALQILRSTPILHGEWRMYDGGIEGLTSAFVHYWRGELDAAQIKLDAVIAENSETPYGHLARVFNAFVTARIGGPHAQAIAHLELRRLPEHTSLGVPWRVWRATAECVLAEAHGRTDTAVRLAKFVLAADDVPVARVIAANVIRSSGDSHGAQNALEGFDPQRTPGYLTAFVEMTRALIANDAGLDNAAHLRLERALDAAAAESAYLPFLIDSTGARELLAQHASWGSSHEAVIGSLLARRSDSVSARDRELSPREQQVLEYMRTSLPASEIAEALFVSVNTVKTHQRAIYRKLGVANRREAVKYRL